MSSKTKIMVIKMREIIYTGIFLALLIVLAFLLIAMFAPGSRTSSDASAPSGSQSSEKQTVSAAQTARYRAGIYTVPVMLGTSPAEVEVIVDETHINAIHLINLGETATAMYPLASPSMDDLAAQICRTQSLEGITCSESSKYTSQLLLNAISQALERAAVHGEESKNASASTLRFDQHTTIDRRTMCAEQS